MEDKEKKSKTNKAWLGVFIVYCFVLLKVILFKYDWYYYWYSLKEWDFSVLQRGYSMANLMPFRSITMYIEYYYLDIGAFENIAGNFLAFLPMGILLPMIWENLRKFDWILVLGALISLFLEVVQLITGFGRFDIDDIILNCLGTVVGYAIYELGIRKALERRKKSSDL
ncbi:MAG: VanZ family protein [Lachnospiraceae bacterium]|nr:VanZ family protein [Lachnospiraceae bacterium]